MQNVHFWNDDTDRTARTTRIARMRVYRAWNGDGGAAYWQGVKDALEAMRAVDRDEPTRLAQLDGRDLTYYGVPSHVREVQQLTEADLA